MGRFFNYYAKFPRVRLEPARLEGREILVVVTDAVETPSYFMLVEWQDHKITLIRDHRYATYAMEGQM